VEGKFDGLGKGRLRNVYPVIHFPGRIRDLTCGVRGNEGEERGSNSESTTGWGFKSAHDDLNAITLEVVGFFSGNDRNGAPRGAYYCEKYGGAQAGGELKQGVREEQVHRKTFRGFLYTYGTGAGVGV